MPRGIFPVKTIWHIGVSALLALAGGLRAASPTMPDLNLVLQIAQEGKFEIALRAVDRNLAIYPDDSRLVELRARLVEALARSAGNPVRVAAATTVVPEITNRVAETGHNFTCETADIPMVWIAPGTFMMTRTHGSDDDTLVTFTRGYWLGRTEVTQEQWQAVMDNVPVPSFFKGSDRPVERVSWVLAMEFTRKLNDRERAARRLPEGYEYTLPTEAQWEYACRAGTTGSYGGDLPAMAWYELNSDRQTHPVAQLRPNAWGLYDMHGNVSEWCADGYGGYPGGHVTDPTADYSGPSGGSARIIRGGSWANSAGECRSSNCYWQSLNYSGAGVGFRLALAPLPKSPAVEKPRGG